MHAGSGCQNIGVVLMAQLHHVQGGRGVKIYCDQESMGNSMAYYIAIHQMVHL
jgi:hypothetical protein